MDRCPRRTGCSTRILPSPNKPFHIGVLQSTDAHAIDSVASVIYWAPSLAGQRQRRTMTTDRVAERPAPAITSAPAHPYPVHGIQRPPAAVSITGRTEMTDRFNFCRIGRRIDSVSFKHGQPTTQGQLVRSSANANR